MTTLLKDASGRLLALYLMLQAVVLLSLDIVSAEFSVKAGRKFVVFQPKLTTLSLTFARCDLPENWLESLRFRLFLLSRYGEGVGKVVGGGGADVATGRKGLGEPWLWFMNRGSNLIGLSMENFELWLLLERF